MGQARLPEINWPLSAKSLDDTLDDTLSTNLVDLSCLDSLEAAVPVIVVVRKS